MNNSKAVWWAFPIIFAVALFLFYPSLNYYFFQDDWFVLNWVREGDWKSFFAFRTDIIYWRPLSMPLFFAIGKLLFGLNPLGFHLVAFILHFINIVLVYLLARQLKLKVLTSYFIAFIWGTAAFHFVPLSWLSTTSYIIGPTFIFATIIFFLKSKMKLSFLFFILALASSEFALVAIPLLAIFSTNIKRAVKNLSLFLMIVILYLVPRFLIFPIPARDSYAPASSVKILVNLFWYLMWLFNIAERFSTIFYFSTIKNAAGPFRIFFTLLIGPIFIVIAFLLLAIVSKIGFKTIAKGMLWFLIGLSPVIFLPNHTYAMYLSVASLGIFYILGSLLERTKKFQIPIFIIIAVVWFTSSSSTVNFLRSNHWAVNEQTVSRAYSKYILTSVPNPPSDSIFVFHNASMEYAKKYNFVLLTNEDQISQSLFNQDAVQVLYNNSSLKSIYAKAQDKPVLPKDKQVFEIIPR